MPILISMNRKCPECQLMFPLLLYSISPHSLVSFDSTCSWRLTPKSQSIKLTNATTLNDKQVWTLNFWILDLPRQGGLMNDLIRFMFFSLSGNNCMAPNREPLAPALTMWQHLRSRLCATAPTHAVSASLRSPINFLYLVSLNTFLIPYKFYMKIWTNDRCEQTTIDEYN